MELSAEIIKEMGQIVDNNDAMSRLLKYVKKLVRQTKQVEKSDSIDDTTLMSDLEEGFRQIKLSREGKIKLKTAEEFLNEL